MPPAATGKLGLPVGGVGCGLGDDAGYRFRLRHIDRVAGRDLGHGGADPVGHSLLRRWRDHPVFAGDQVPAGLGPPGGVGDRPGRGGHVPGNLRVGQERGLAVGQVGGERGVELVPVQEQEAVAGRQDRRLRSVGGNPAMSEPTDSSLSGAKAHT